MRQQIKINALTFIVMAQLVLIVVLAGYILECKKETKLVTVSEFLKSW